MHKCQGTLKEYYIMNKEVCSNSELISKLHIVLLYFLEFYLPINYLHK